jgi:hypothetical protein
MEEGSSRPFPQPSLLGLKSVSRQTPPPIDLILDSKASQLESEIRQQNTSIRSV